MSGVPSPSESYYWGGDYEVVSANSSSTKPYPDPAPFFATRDEVEGLQVRMKELEAMVSTLWNHPLMPGGQQTMLDEKKSEVKN